MTKIAILGAGKVGTSLARVAVEGGYQVDIAASGAPDRIALIFDVLAPCAHATTAAEAVVGAELVVLALPLHKFRRLDTSLLAGHVVLDIMNYWTPIDGEISEFDDAPEGTSVLVQRALPASRVVKTLNHIGYHELDEEPRSVGADDRMALGAVGDDPDAVARVLAFLERIGFDAIDAGPLANGVAFQPGSPLFGAPYPADRFRELLAAELDRVERAKIAA
jgi:8-hydroxy-5-deazaflavin:NADPH oxidoreductase